MAFTSIHFLLFVPLVVAVYFAIPFRYRWLWLLLASYYFYMSWQPEYVLLLIGTTTVTFFTARWMAAATNPTTRKGWLVVSLLCNLGALFLFKYFNFFSDSVRLLLQQVSITAALPEWNLLLPIGISFYTFKTLSYIIDVYRGRQQPETHWGLLALYVAFFPQLVAGPIDRAGNILPQFHTEQKLDPQQIGAGLRLILWGFFKKVVIADRLAFYVNTVYNNPGAHTGLPIWVATYLLAFQIYCDFSAYSDIAIGTAQLMGYKTMRNFQQPYFALSVPEFWRRWHISLSTWFRDYLYIPLGGNRVPQWRLYLNLVIVFVVSGLWHGANWTFVIWGFLHGLYSVASVAWTGLWHRITQPLRTKPYLYLVNGINLLVTFHLVVLAWLFFRANSLTDAMLLLRNATQLDGINVKSLLIINPNQLVIAGGALLVLIGVDLLHSRGQLTPFLARRPLWVRWSLYYLMLIGILAFGEYRSQDFIYAQF